MPCYLEVRNRFISPPQPRFPQFSTISCSLCLSVFCFFSSTPMRITTAAGTFCFSFNPPSLSSSPLQLRPLPVKHFGSAVEAQGKILPSLPFFSVQWHGHESVRLVPVNRNATPDTADLQTCSISSYSRLIRATKPSENTVILAVVPQK